MNLSRVVKRVNRAKAIGIVYNIPQEDLADFDKKFKNLISFDGKEVYHPTQLVIKLRQLFGLKRFSFNLLPALIEDKLIVIQHADFIGCSYNRVFSEFHQFKIPLLLLLNDERNMESIRNYKAYKSSLIIESDYKVLNHN
jgi:hypothetical protein